MAVPGGGGGTFFGGWVIKRFRMGKVAVLKFCIALTTVNIFVHLSYLMYCPNTSFAGVNFPYETE